MNCGFLPERRASTLIGLQALSLGVIAAATFPNAFHFHALDLLIYHGSSLAVLQGRWPSVDGQMVYPPLALVPFFLPHLMAIPTGPALSLEAYARLWPLVSIGLSGAVSLWLFHSPSATSLPSGSRVFRYTVFAILSGPILLWRYDLFPALLALAAAFALWKERPFIAGLYLGAGIAAKLYPVFLLPVFGLYLWARGEQKRGTPRFLLGTSIAAVVPFLPFAMFQPNLLASLLTYHSHRGLEIESLYAGWVALLSHLALTEARPVLHYGTWDLASPMATFFLRWQPLAFALTYAGSLVHAWRQFRQAHAEKVIPPDRLMSASLNALLAFVVTNKVFSPQYITWLLPFGAFLKKRYLPVFLAVILLTLVDFPFLFDRLILLELGPVLIVNLRNLLAVFLMVWQMIDRPG